MVALLPAAFDLLDAVVNRVDVLDKLLVHLVVEHIDGVGGVRRVGFAEVGDERFPVMQVDQPRAAELRGSVFRQRGLHHRLEGRLVVVVARRGVVVHTADVDNDIRALEEGGDAAAEDGCGAVVGRVQQETAREGLVAVEAPAVGADGLGGEGTLGERAADGGRLEARFDCAEDCLAESGHWRCVGYVECDRKAVGKRNRVKGGREVCMRGTERGVYISF